MKLFVQAVKDLLLDLKQHILDMDSAYGTEEVVVLVRRIDTAIRFLESL